MVAPLLRGQRARVHERRGKAGQRADRVAGVDVGRDLADEDAAAAEFLDLVAVLAQKFGAFQQRGGLLAVKLGRDGLDEHLTHDGRARGAQLLKEHALVRGVLVDEEHLAVLLDDDVRLQYLADDAVRRGRDGKLRLRRLRLRRGRFWRGPGRYDLHLLMDARLRLKLARPRGDGRAEGGLRLRHADGRRGRFWLFGERGVLARGHPAEKVVLFLRRRFLRGRGRGL